MGTLAVPTATFAATGCLFFQNIFHFVADKLSCLQLTSVVSRPCKLNCLSLCLYTLFGCTGLPPRCVFVWCASLARFFDATCAQPLAADDTSLDRARVRRVIQSQTISHAASKTMTKAEKITIIIRTHSAISIPLFSILHLLSSLASYALGIDSIPFWCYHIYRNN